MIKKILNVRSALILIIIVASLLRLYKLSYVPPSLFGDELDLGYQAYSILKTGNDYSGNFLPIHFRSISEWRTPLYLYAAVPTVAIFGITPLGVRLPAAIFGVLCIVSMFLLGRELTRSSGEKNSQIYGLVSGALMAINPWMLQYSRAGFEVTLMIFLLLMGTYLFIRSQKDPKYLYLSVICLALTPWVYSTAKLFTPLLVIVLLFIYKKGVLKMNRKILLTGFFVGIILGVPIVYSTFFGGGTQRISDISVLNDPNMEQFVGEMRDIDANVHTPILLNRLFNNKFVYFGGKVINNYLQSFSPEFLFIYGDSNLRQSTGVGELYLIEFAFLILGLMYFFSSKEVDHKPKLLVIFWLILSPLASSLTLGGGNHATRLILMAPILVFLISYAYVSIYNLLSRKTRLLYVAFVALLYISSFGFYMHRYYSLYPVVSAKWWHYGWGPAIHEIKKIDKDYEKVIISMAGEPAWIFFAGWYAYPPYLWQNEFPIGNDVVVSGFGKISHTGKFYFGSPEKEIQLYGIGKYINSKTLYLANASEDGDNLILYPEKTPEGLKLIKSISLPSGEPAFYLFSGKEK
jgi:4-amino-4-deoxy-L-arabinose transferase-like glycosyltransferase